jgi:molecular chaperone DnaK (HSP70)
MLSVEDGQLINDGTDTETITVSSSVSRDIDAILEVDGTEFPVVIPASSEYTQNVTTTKTAGSSIEVRLMGIFNEPTAVTIEVTN